MHCFRRVNQLIVRTLVSALAYSVCAWQAGAQSARAEATLPQVITRGVTTGTAFSAFLTDLGMRADTAGLADNALAFHGMLLGHATTIHATVSTDRVIAVRLALEVAEDQLQATYCEVRTQVVLELGSTISAMPASGCVVSDTTTLARQRQLGLARFAMWAPTRRDWIRVSMAAVVPAVGRPAAVVLTWDTADAVFLVYPPDKF